MEYKQSYDDIISISLTGAPAGAAKKNVNNIMLLTNETPGNSDPFRVYKRSSDVGTDYGTSSETKAMADMVFSQDKTPLSGGGKLIIAPMQAAVKATAGYFTTADLSSNVAAIIVVDDGDLKVTLNGTDYNLTGLDFTNAEDLDDIAAVVQEALPNAIVTVVGNTIKITSKKVGDDADVTLGAVAGGGGTDLTAAGLFNVAGGSATSGVDSSGETVLQAIARVEGGVAFCGVMTNLDIEDDVVTATALAVQATTRIFLHHFASLEDIAGIVTTLKNAGYDRTRSLLYTTSLSSANLMKAAYAGRAFSTNFNGSKTCQTMQLKTLKGPVADLGIDPTSFLAAIAAGADTYVSFDGDPGVSCSSGNKFFDQVYNRTALKYYLQAAGYNVIKTTGTKVPQEESGMDALKGAYAKVYKTFTKNGYIGVGLVWNSAEVFGNPEDLKRNITDVGFYIYSDPIAEQDQDDRDARIAPLVQQAVKEAGAIHSNDVIVIVEA